MQCNDLIKANILILPSISIIDQFTPSYLPGNKVRLSKGARICSWHGWRSSNRNISAFNLYPKLSINASLYSLK